jgi:hypothetical protein
MTPLFLAFDARFALPLQSGTFVAESESGLLQPWGSLNATWYPGSSGTTAHIPSLFHLP